MQSEKMNPRLLITLTIMLLSQSVLLAVSPLVTDDADTTRRTTTDQFRFHVHTNRPDDVIFGPD